MQGFTNIHVTTRYVQHFMAGLLALVANQASGIVHVASRDCLTKYEIGLLVAATFGLDVILVDRVCCAIR